MFTNALGIANYNKQLNFHTLKCSLLRRVQFAGIMMAISSAKCTNSSYRVYRRPSGGMSLMVSTQLNLLWYSNPFINSHNSWLYLLIWPLLTTDDGYIGVYSAPLCTSLPIPTVLCICIGCFIY